ncbi:hypothetical protein [Microbacterium gilvum]|uniref:HutD family protein n=1 Tax=Microbacterium gilvum TaxID=1336204 RepID=A0ABP9A787_9MICO
MSPLPRVLPLRDQPGQRLLSGIGAVRDVQVETAPGERLLWMLQIVELRSAEGAASAPAGTRQLVAGLSGPQLSIRKPQGLVPLRRDRASELETSAVLMRRPSSRPSGASRMLLLSYDAAEAAPSLAFHGLDGEHAFAGGTRVLIALEGELSVDGQGVPPLSAAVLDPEHPVAVRAHGARFIAVRVTQPVGVR